MNYPVGIPMPVFVLHRVYQFSSRISYQTCRIMAAAVAYGGLQLPDPKRRFWPILRHRLGRRRDKPPNMNQSHTK